MLLDDGLLVGRFGLFGFCGYGGGVWFDGDEVCFVGLNREYLVF